MSTNNNQKKINKPMYMLPSDFASIVKNPIYTVPFVYGFTREIVQRKKCKKRTTEFDVYYYSSINIKLRSLQDVKRYLSSLPPSRFLSIKNFTFKKVPICVGAPQEIIRKAYQKNHIRSHPLVTKAIQAQEESTPNTHNETSLNIPAIMDNAIEQYMTKQEQNNDPSNQNQASTSK